MPTLLDYATGTTVVPERDIELTHADDVVIRVRFRHRGTLKAVDWTGWVFASQCRDDLGNLLATGSCTHNGVGGEVVVLFPKADTTALIPGQFGTWDLQGTDPLALVRTVLRGAVLVTADVTP